METQEESSTDTPARIPKLGIREAYAFVIVVGFLLLLYLARSALAPYLLALLGIYILLPVVRFVERQLPDSGRWKRFRRPLAVAAAMVAALAILVVVLSVLIAPIIQQLTDLIENFDSYWESINSDYPDLVEWYEDVVPEELRVRINEQARQLVQDLVPGVTGLLGWLVGATGSLISAVIAFVATPLFIIYYLLDEPKTLRNLRRELPPRWTGDAISLFRIIDRLMGDYTRGVMLMALIVGCITGFGYWIIGVDLWLPLGFIAFAGEIVPIIGPWIAFFISFPAILATQPDRAIYAGILFLIIQALEGWFLAPRIEGNAVRFTSAGTLLLLSIGGALAGGLGVVFALPVAAILRALVVYGSHRLNGCSPDDALALVPIFDDSEPSRDEK